jgi:hypothetical protein
MSSAPFGTDLAHALAVQAINIQLLVLVLFTGLLVWCDDGGTD